MKKIDNICDKYKISNKLLQKILDKIKCKKHGMYEEETVNTVLDYIDFKSYEDTYIFIDDLVENEILEEGSEVQDDGIWGLYFVPNKKK